MKKHFLLILASVLLLSACKDKNDYTPATLKFTTDAFDDCFNVDNFNSEHSQSYDSYELNAIKQHKFTHVYVSYGGDALGVWELPCEVPILDIDGSDSSTVTIIPCFKKNGQSSTIKGYSYIKSYKINLFLQKGQTLLVDKNTFKGRYQYHKYAEFFLIEPFVTNQHFTPYDILSSTANFTCIADPSDPTNRIGEIALTDDSLNNTFAVVSVNNAQNQSWTFDISNQTYLEMRYKCDNEMSIEIYAPGYFSIYPCGGLYATDTWQTVYINLDERLGNIYSTGSTYTGYMNARIVLSGAKLDGQDTTRYQIDYIKIITGPNS